MPTVDRRELVKVLQAHAETVAVAEACASTTRDLATEVKRGGTPAREDLQRTIEEAERVLADLDYVRAEVQRLLEALR